MQPLTFEKALGVNGGGEVYDYEGVQFVIHETESLSLHQQSPSLQWRQAALHRAPVGTHKPSLPGRGALQFSAACYC